LRGGLILSVALLVGCGAFPRSSESPAYIPGFLQPLAVCAERHGYRLPPVSYLSRKATALSNGAATCCIAGSEAAVVHRWDVVGCYGAVPVEKREGFVLKIAGQCTGRHGEQLTANRWYAHHELTHIILRAATNDWDDEHASALWTECPNPFDPHPLFGDGR